MSYSHRKLHLFVCIAFLTVALVHPGKTSPVSSEPASPPNPANCDLTKHNSTSGSAAAEPEPVAEPKPAEAEAKPAESSSSATTTTTTTTPKSAEAKTTATTTTTTATPKPATKSAVTTPTTTTVKPAAALNIIETKSESVPKPVESLPLKVESRDGKALNLNKTEYEHEHASPEPQPEPESGKPISGNGTEHKNDTMKKDAGKTNEKLTMTPVNETVEKKNASLSMDGKKHDEKAAGHGAEAKKDESTKKDGSANSTTTAQPSPTAAANINGSPSLMTPNLVISFLSLSILVFTTKDILC